METEKLPFFFYGTLRPGERNYVHLLQGRTIREEAGWWLPGAQLYLYSSGEVYTYLKGSAQDYQPKGAYPYMTTGSGRVAGHLIELRPEIYHDLLTELDWLEGFSEDAPPEQNEYVREVREIEHENGAVTKAWVYLASAHAFARQKPNLHLIESGDWLVWRKNSNE